MERALAALGASLALRVIDQIAGGEATEVEQDHAQATYAAKIERHEGTIDWSLPAARIHNLVRGLQPWPLVTVTVDGARCRIHRSTLTGETTSASPGVVTAAANGVLAVAAGDGSVLRILEIQPEGKRVMPVRDFLSGHAVAVGTRLA